MANSNKTTYIIIGIVLLIVAVPVLIIFLGFLGGMFYYFQGAN